MKTTTNYKLKKPDLTDDADITRLNANWDTIDTNLKKQQDNTQGVINGLDGQVLVSENSIIKARNVVEIKRIALHASDVEMLKLNATGTSEIFNNWDRHTINWSLTPPIDNPNSNDHKAYQTAWTFDPDTNAIDCKVNVSSYGIFISKQKYDQYNITFYGTNNYGGDDDALCIVIGSIIGDDGYIHTLSAVRATGVNVVRCNWQLIYDFSVSSGSNGSVVLVNNDSAVNGPANNGSWKLYPQYLQVSRNKTHVTCITSDYRSGNSNKNLDSKTTITYDLPSSKPNNLTNTQWKNLQRILTEPCQIGVGVNSNQANFKIVSQDAVFPDDRIFDVENDQVLELRGNTWTNVGKVSDILDARQIYFNEIQKILMYYDGINFYTLAQTV